MRDNFYAIINLPSCSINTVVRLSNRDLLSVKSSFYLPTYLEQTLFSK